MSRSILFVLVYLCHSLFSTLSIAQSVGGTAATGSDQNNPNQKPQYQTGRPVRGAVDARVSVARLSVPRKARQLYEKALEAWQQQKPAEAQRKIDQALKIEPAFPEALTLNGFMQASHRQWASAEQSPQASIRTPCNSKCSPGAATRPRKCCKIRCSHRREGGHPESMEGPNVAPVEAIRPQR